MKTEQRSGIDRRQGRATAQARLRAIVERLADGIVIVGWDGIVRFSNPAAQQLFGRPGHALKGAHLGFPAVAGESAEIEIVRAGGTTISVELRVVEIEWEGDAAHLVSLRDVTDRRRAEERAAQLEREQLARAEAEAANRAKSEFLAMMSHELRTPLNAVIGYAELLHVGIGGALTEAQRAHVSRIRTSAHHLLALVNEVLDLTRIDAGRLSLQWDSGRTQDAARAALALVQPAAESRAVSISADRTDDPETLYQGDEDRVRQILVNLLTNAVKFTEPGGRVSVHWGVAEQPHPAARLRGLAPWVYLSVADTGMGIPPEQLSAIFDPFVQVDSGHTRPKDGSGLGLTISRRLARLMKGDLTVESQVGQGSVFTLWLPAATATAADAAQRSDQAGDADQLRGLADVGELLLHELEHLVDAFVARLRSERIIPSADSLRFSQLAGHVATYVADIAGVLIAVEETQGQPSGLIADRSEIERLVAERHGANRARLGWSPDALSREWGILREEIDRVIRQGARALPSLEAVALIERRIEQAKEIGIRALHRTRNETVASDPGYP